MILSAWIWTSHIRSRPSCIAHGSEKQGGQHEGSMPPVTSPVSLVISLTLDGKEANMDNLNIWHKHNVEAGVPQAHAPAQEPQVHPQPFPEGLGRAQLQ
jgi:hypothetical protein